MVRVLMVCMGNICRSPMAEGVARALARNQGLETLVEFDSAGTHSYHVGEPPDERACQVAAKRGYRIAELRARKVSREDFARFDLLLAADSQNVEALRRLCPEEGMLDKIKLMLDFVGGPGLQEVPDPYYGNLAGFERVLDLCEQIALGVLDHVKHAEGIR